MPDALGVVRAWVRAQELVPEANVVFAVPEQDTPPLPLIVISRVGGPINHWLDSARITFECWDQNKSKASKLATQVAVRISNVFDTPIFTYEDWAVTGADIDQITERPGTTWAKRFHVDAQFHIHM